MMLDAQTLFFSMWLTVTVMSIALATVVGVRRPGLRAWNGALMLQSGGWALLIVSLHHRGLARELSTLGASALVGSLSAMYAASCHYLQRRAQAGWVWGPPLLALVVHWLVFNSFMLRIAWINLLLAIQMLWLAWLLLRRQAQPVGRGWRWLAGVAVGLSALTVLARVALVLWAPESYPTFTSGHWLNVTGLVVNDVALTVGTLAFLLAHRGEAEQALRRLATIDSLTGLLNRRTLLERGATLAKLAQREQRPLTLLMIDLDHFKQINDRHGHPMGDKVLSLFGQALQKALRAPDLAGRYGGEEFCVLLPFSGGEAALAVDRRLRGMLREGPSRELGLAIDYSAGAATLAAAGGTLEELISRADKALYEAKHGGRGRLVLAAPAPA
jgi:diguanylate cyclase (GGDEF)-like protein